MEQPHFLRDQKSQALIHLSATTRCPLINSTKFGSTRPTLNTRFSSRSTSHSLTYSPLTSTKLLSLARNRRQSSHSLGQSSFIISQKSRSQSKNAPFFFISSRSAKGCTKVTAMSSSETFYSLFLQLALIQQTANFSLPKANNWLRLLSSTFKISPPNSQSPIFLAEKSKRETWLLLSVALPKRSYMSVACASLKVRIRSKGWSLIESNLLPPIISLFLISFFLSYAKGHHLKMCFLSSASHYSLRIKRTLASAATMDESTSMRYSSLSTAFLATSLFCAKSYTSILLCFSTWNQFSVYLLMVASSMRQAMLSPIFITFFMTSLGKLWMVASCSLLHTKTHLFYKFIPTTLPPDVTYKFSTGYSSELAQQTGTELASNLQRFTPLLEILKQSVGSPGRAVTLLNCSCSLVNVPNSLPPFLEQSTILLPAISEQVSPSMSTTQLSYFMRLYRSSRRRSGSTSSIWLDPRQQRYTLGVCSIDWMMASSSRLSSHSSYSGRCTSTGQNLSLKRPQESNPQQQTNLFSPYSSEVSTVAQPLLASTFSIIVGISTASTTRLSLRETETTRYMPKTTKKLGLAGRTFAQNCSSLVSTSMESWKAMPSRRQKKSRVPSMSTNSSPATMASQRAGLQRQYFSRCHAKATYYFIIIQIQLYPNYHPTHLAPHPNKPDLPLLTLKQVIIIGKS